MFGSALWSLNQVLAAAIRKRVQAGSLIHADATPAPQGASIIQEKWVAGVCTIVFIIWCLVVHDAYICISVCRQDVLQLYYAPLVLGYLFHVIRFSAVLLNSIRRSILMTMHFSWSSRSDYVYTTNQIGSKSSQYQLLCNFGFATNNFKAVGTRYLFTWIANRCIYRCIYTHIY